MSREPIVLIPRGGEGVAAHAELVRYAPGQRIARGGGVVVGGIVLGAVSILIPGVHLISTWLLPLLGLAIGGYLYTVRARVGKITGTCPSCGQAMTIDDTGSVGHDDVWVRCNLCAHPLRVVLGEERA